MARDNISGIKGGILKKAFLLPGMIIQWIMYMSVGKLRYGQLRQNTRLARSPFMTWVFSSFAWGYLGLTVYETENLQTYLPSKLISELTFFSGEPKKLKGDQSQPKREAEENPVQTFDAKKPGFVTSSSALFESANMRSNVIKQLSSGTEIRILGISPDRKWYRISFEDRTTGREYEGFMTVSSVALLVIR